MLAISLTSEKEVSRQALSDRDRFSEFEQHLSGGSANKGLEGIAFNRDTGTFFLLKEGEPSLMIEVS